MESEWDFPQSNSTQGPEGKANPEGKDGHVCQGDSQPDGLNRTLG